MVQARSMFGCRRIGWRHPISPATQLRLRWLTYQKRAASSTRKRTSATWVRRCVAHPKASVYLTFRSLTLVSAFRVAVYLGLNPLTDEHLFWLAEEALVAPLPGSWTLSEVDGPPKFVDLVTGCESTEHPLDPCYRNIFLREKEAERHFEEQELMALKDEAEAIAAGIVRDGLGTPAGLPGYLDSLEESAILNANDDVNVDASIVASAPAPTTSDAVGASSTLDASDYDLL
eukprot:SAG31_NODE_11594_length_1015_cov_1.005459_1_plen_230_part_10